MSLKVWGRRSGFNVQKVLWLIGELQLDHEHIPAGGTISKLDTPEFLALNPNGKIPVIDDDGKIVWESHSILRYLAARYAKAQGQARFWSDDAGERSDSDRWLDWFQTALQPAFLDGIFIAFYRTPEAKRDWNVINKGIARTTQLLQLLEKQLEGKAFINGDVLSLADIAVGTVLYRYFNLDIQRAELPKVAAYYARLSARPAYQQHVQIPFDELYGNLG